MDGSKSNVLIIVLIIMAAIVGAAVGNTITGRPLPPERRPDASPPDPTVYIMLKTAFACVNTVVSAALLALYVSTYKQIRSRFAMGLILVMLSFFIYAVTSNPMMHELFGFRVFGLGPFTLIPDVFAMLALLSMLYLSLE
jgi:hypothetical protein